MTREQLRYFAAESQRRGFFRVVEGQLIQQAGEEARIGPIGSVDTNNGVRNRFVVDVHLLGERTLVQVEDSCAYLEVLVEGVVESVTDVGLCCRLNSDWLSSDTRIGVFDLSSPSLMIFTRPSV